MLHDNALTAPRNATASVTLESLVPADHLLRRVSDAIAWETHCRPLRALYSAARGRPAAAPEVLLAIAILRHIYRIDSLRLAAAELSCNLAFRWFAGCPLDTPAPHFSTFSANLLHRIPSDVFENALCGALGDILDAGVLSAEEVLFPSSVLSDGDALRYLTENFRPTELQLALPETDAKPEVSSEVPEVQQLTLLE